MDAETKVLVIMPTLDICGGIERFFMNYYSRMPHNIKFDIITHHSDSEKYQKQIKKKGDNLFVLPVFTAKNVAIISNEAKKIISANHYDVMHCQMANAGFLYLKLAKKYGIKTRILHSHQCKYADKKLNALRNIPLIELAKHYANYYVACGEDAGKFMFGKKQFAVLNNALDPNEFKRNMAKRKEYRKKLKIKENEKLLGIFGRLAPQKNHGFALRLLSKMPNYKLLIMGNGELEQSIEQTIDSKGLKSSTIMLKSTDDIANYYNAIDALIMPSFYEGLPFVGIEAQFANLPCYFANTITRELKISKNCHFLPIGEEDINKWVKMIMATTESANQLLSNSRKYNLNEQAKELTKLYYMK